jgi:acetyl esterase/lipase
MSLSAEILRLALRYFVKRRLTPDPPVALLRQRVQSVHRFIPAPPRGTRELSIDAAGIGAVRVATARSRNERHVLYLHGGGYVTGSPAEYRDFLWRIADAASGWVTCIDYRLAPEHPFPAALDDAVKTFSWLLAQGVAPRRTVIMGDSSGGGLALATLLRLRNEALPLPGAAVALSPWTDLALSGDSMRSNAYADPVMKVERAQAVARHYLAGADPRQPYASPLYGNLAGLPPILIQVGSDEILRDDSVRMAESLQASGSAVELEVWPRMPHSWQLYARILPEGRRAIARIGAFVDRQIT